MNIVYCRTTIKGTSTIVVILRRYLVREQGGTRITGQYVPKGVRAMEGTVSRRVRAHGHGPMGPMGLMCNVSCSCFTC